MAKPLVFVVGDSISIQYGPYLKKMSEAFIEYDRKRDNGQAMADLDRPVGGNGGDSGMVLEFLERECARGFEPDYLVLNCGLHDIKTDPQTGAKQVPIERYEKNLRAILALLRGRRTRVIWVRTTPVDDEQHNTRSKSFLRYRADALAYNETADRVMRGAGVPLIDLHAFTLSLGPGVFCDHVHFTEQVRALQAAYIAGYLQAIIGSR